MHVKNALVVLSALAVAAVLLSVVTCTAAPGPSPAGSPPSTSTPPPEGPDDGLEDDDFEDDFEDDFVTADEEIHDAVHDALENSPDVDARSISVRVEDGDVYLSGTVRSQREHDLAHDLAHAVEGVRAVYHEELKVR